LYVYFIDQDSGLAKINKDYILNFGNGLKIVRGENILKETTDNIIKEVNTSLSSYMVNGAFPIGNINNSIFPYNYNKSLDFTLLEINDDVKKILETNYKFDTSRFNHTFTNIDEIKRFYLN
jgi:hypothetical protein